MSSMFDLIELSLATVIDCILQNFFWRESIDYRASQYIENKFCKFLNWITFL